MMEAYAGYTIHEDKERENLRALCAYVAANYWDKKRSGKLTFEKIKLPTDVIKKSKIEEGDRERVKSFVKKMKKTFR